MEWNALRGHASIIETFNVMHKDVMSFGNPPFGRRKGRHSTKRDLVRFFSVESKGNTLPYNIYFDFYNSNNMLKLKWDFK